MATTTDSVRMMRSARPVKQWIFLGALVAGLGGAGVGYLLDQPNSWWWFAIGAASVLIYAAVRSLPVWRARRRGIEPADSPHDVGGAT